MLLDAELYLLKLSGNTEFRGCFSMWGFRLSFLSVASRGPIKSPGAGPFPGSILRWQESLGGVV